MSRLSALEFDTECLIESLREQIPRLARAKVKDRPELSLQILSFLDAFMLEWFPKEPGPTEPSASGDGMATKPDERPA